MKNSAIMESVNNQYRLDNLIPLAGIKTKARCEELEKEGYFIGYTEPEWMEEFPDVDVNKVFVHKSQLFIGGFVYWDAEKYIYLPMPFNSPELLSAFPNAKHTLRQTLRAAEQAAKDGDYESVLYASASEQSGNVTAAILNMLIKNKPVTNELCNAFFRFFVFSDCGTLEIEPSSVLKLKENMPKKTRNAVARSVKHLPDELTIYRGQGNKSTPHNRAYSWSLSEDVAAFFAARHGGEEACMVKAKVKKGDILHYTNSRSEQEVIVHPDDVYDAKPTFCVALTDFQRVVSSGVEEMTDDFDTQYDLNPQNLMAQIEDIYEDKGLQDHDYTHTIRVMLLAIYIYKQRLYTAMEKNDADIDELLKLFVLLTDAITCHDVAREHDGVDESHGAEGYEVYQEMHGEENEIVKFLTTYHCIDDEAARKEWSTTFATHPMADEIWTLYCVMKDADALDRCRLGLHDIDMSLLRLPDSKYLYPLAVALLDYKV